MILILAKGATYRLLNQVYEIQSSDQAHYHYGRASALSFACDRAFALGQTSLFACNVQSESDYFESIEQIRSLLPEYVLLPGLRFDQRLKLKDGRNLPIALILSELLPNQKFILTDYHASDFVDMSHFLKHYNALRLELDQLAVHKPNITLVANHLRESAEASIDVACSLLDTAIGAYPMLKCGETYYALESEDFRAPLVFFKHQLSVALFNIDSGIESNLVVQRMVAALKKELTETLDYLIGSRFSRNTLFTVKALTEKVLSLREGTYYKKYRLVDITIVNDEILIDIDVYPYFTMNVLHTQVTIKGI